MTAATLIASLALLCSLVSIAIACLAYRRAGAIDVAVELNIERVLAHPDWWFVAVSLRNRSAISLIPIEIRLSRPRSARLSAYLGPILGEKDEKCPFEHETIIERLFRRKPEMWCASNRAARLKGLAASGADPSAE